MNVEGVWCGGMVTVCAKSKKSRKKKTELCGLRNTNLNNTYTNVHTSAINPVNQLSTAKRGENQP